MEGRCLGLGVEVEVDEDVAVVVDGVGHAVGSDPCTGSHRGESVEGSLPRGEVGDGVLDVECVHGSSVRRRRSPRYPRKLGPDQPRSYSGHVDMPGRRGLESDAIERLARDVDDSRSLRTELLTRVRAVVEFDWYAFVLTDPATSVGVDPLADLPDPAAIPSTIRLKYLTPVNRWTSLDGAAALGTRASESVLWRDEQARHGVVDVVSVALRDRYGCWGFVDLWSTRPYAAADVALFRDLAPSFTRAVRQVRARSFHGSGSESVTTSGPAVLVLGDDLAIRDQAQGSDEWLQLLLPQPDGTRPIPACAYNVAAQLLAREAGVDDNPAMARMPLPGGSWVTLRASRLQAHHEIAVTIEQTTPHERLDVFCRAHGLSLRESELLTVLAAGADTAAASAKLHLSPHTVQDHLKAVFVKTGEHSRRALLFRALGDPHF